MPNEWNLEKKNFRFVRILCNCALWSDLVFVTSAHSYTDAGCICKLRAKIQSHSRRCGWYRSMNRECETHALVFGFMERIISLERSLPTNRPQLKRDFPKELFCSDGLGNIRLFFIDRMTRTLSRHVFVMNRPAKDSFPLKIYAIELSKRRVTNYMLDIRIGFWSISIYQIIIGRSHTKYRVRCILYSSHRRPRIKIKKKHTLILICCKIPSQNRMKRIL